MKKHKTKYLIIMPIIATILIAAIYLNQGTLLQGAFNIKSINNPISTSVPTTHTLDKTPLSLVPIQPIPYIPIHNKSSSKTLKTIGETWEFKPNKYIRHEGTAPDGNGLFSIWQQDSGGCKFLETRKLNTTGDFGSVFENTYITGKYRNKWLYIEIMNNENALTTCHALQSDAWGQTLCEAIPQSGRYSISNQIFKLVYENISYTPAEYLYLIGLTTGYNNLLINFPSLSLSIPHAGFWLSINKKTFPFDAAAINGGENIFAQSNPRLDQIYSTSLEAYNEALANPAVFAMRNYEMHDFIHALFNSSQLSSLTYDSTYRQMQVEGLANYLMVKGILPSISNCTEAFPAIQCNKTSYSMNNVNHSYASLDDGYIIGTCFYFAVENTCGLRTLDQTFGEIIKQAYAPKESYKNLFGIIDNYCPNKKEYHQIITDFHIPYSQLKESKVLHGTENLLPGTACPISLHKIVNKF